MIKTITYNRWVKPMLLEKPDYYNQIHLYSNYTDIDVKLELKNDEVDIFTTNIQSLMGKKVIVKCQYCGQYGAVKTECLYCGAPIDFNER